MASKKINLIIWLVKAAELDVIQKCCMKKLIGLHFDVIYTLPYAMCLNTVSEIIADLEIEEDQNIVSTSRFSSIGLVPPAEMALMQQRVAEFVKKTPITLDVWKDVAGKLFDLAVQKAQASIIKTCQRAGKKMAGQAPSPSWRSTTTGCRCWSCWPSPSTPHSGSRRRVKFVELRFEGLVEGKNVSAKLLYAALERWP